MFSVHFLLLGDHFFQKPDYVADQEVENESHIAATEQIEVGPGIISVVREKVGEKGVVVDATERMIEICPKK